MVIDMTILREKVAIGNIATFFGTRLGLMSINRVLKIYGIDVNEGNKSEKLAEAMNILYVTDKDSLSSFIDSIISIHKINEKEKEKFIELKRKIFVDIGVSDDIESDEFYEYLKECLQPPESRPADEGKRDSTIITLCKRLNEMNKNYIIVDYGCGKGRLLSGLEILDKKIIPLISYIGVDNNDEYLKVNKKYYESSSLYKNLRNYELMKPQEFFNRDEKVDFIFMINVLHEITDSYLPFVIKKCIDKLNINSGIIIHETIELLEGELGFITWDEVDFKIFFQDTNVDVRTLSFETRVPRIYVDLIKIHDDCKLCNFITGYHSMLSQKLEKIKRNLIEIERGDKNTKKYAHNLILKNKITDLLMPYMERQIDVTPYNIVDIESCPLCENKDLDTEYHSDDTYGIEIYILKCKKCGWEVDASL